MLKVLFALLSKSNRKSLSDEEIIEEYLKSQNSYYFDILYNRYSAKIFGKCLTLLRDEYKAQDATQDIMMKILLNLTKFSGNSKFSTWVYSITYNFCIDSIRKGKKDKSILLDDVSVISDVVDEVSDKFLLEVKLERLKKILELINIDDKSILLMKYMDGMSIKDIAKIQDKSESAIKMKIKRAKEKFIKVYNTQYKNQWSMAEMDKNSFEQLKVENEAKFDSYNQKIKTNIDGRKDIWGFFGELIEMYIPRILSTILGTSPNNKDNN